MGVNIIKVLTFLIIFVASFSSQAEPIWFTPDCDDAYYSGRKAFYCEIGGQAFAPTIAKPLSTRIKIWATPNPKILMDLTFIGIALDGNNYPLAPIQIKLDGKLIKEISSSEWLKPSSNKDYFSGLVNIEESIIQKISLGGQLTIEAVGMDGSRKSYLYPTADITGPLMKLVLNKAKDGYKSYHVQNKKPLSKSDPEKLLKLWGPLGEAADRSRYWIYQTKSNDEFEMIELWWTRPQETMAIRMLRCTDSNCNQDETWNIRLNEQAIVNNEPTLAIDMYNDADKAFARSTFLKENEVYFYDIDPVISGDIKSSDRFLAMPFSIYRESDGVNINFNLFSPSTKRDFDKILSNLTTKKQELEKAEIDRQARNVAEADERNAAEKERWRETEEFLEEFQEEQRQNNEAAWANMGNAVLEENNRMRNLERQLESGRGRAIAQGERQYEASVYKANRMTSSSTNQSKVQAPTEDIEPPLNETKVNTPSRKPDTKSTTSDKVAKNNTKPEGKTKESLGIARAWCMKQKNGEFLCNGPLQNGGWGKTLKAALSMVDCPNGQGYTPTVGTGGQSFNCGRELKSSEQVMPTYDPYYNRDKKY